MNALSMSLLLGLMGKAATSGEATCIDASLDRIEWVTDDHSIAALDVPEYPTVNVPGQLATGIPEGVPVKLCAEVKGAHMEIYLTRDPEREERYKKELRDMRRKPTKEKP